MNNSKWGKLILSVWLVLKGLIEIVDFTFPQSGTIMAVIGIVAGVFFLIERGDVKISKYLGILLLSAWLILAGLVEVINLNFTGVDRVLGVIAIAAGVLILFQGFRRSTDN